MLRRAPSFWLGDKATELQYSGGKLEPRVVWDEDGHVIRLVLNDMKLSPEDCSANNLWLPQWDSSVPWFSGESIGSTSRLSRTPLNLAGTSWKHCWPV